MALKTTRRRTRAALGTDADDTDAAVDVKLQEKKKPYCWRELGSFQMVETNQVRKKKKRGRKEAYITVMISPKPRTMPCICAMKMLATATNSAVPSMLMLQPIGRTNLVTLGSTRSLSVIRRKVTGSAAALYKTALEKIGQEQRSIDKERSDFRVLRSRCPMEEEGGHSGVVYSRVIRINSNAEISSISYRIRGRTNAMRWMKRELKKANKEMLDEETTR